MAEVLSEYLRRQAAEPFAYGASDCSTFVVGWLDLVTGITAMDKWLGRFSDRESCEAFIENSGGMGAIAAEFLAAHYGIGPRAAAVGNVVLAKLVNIHAMGIRVTLDGKVALRMPAGLMITQRADIVAEWGPQCLPS
jgi:hypothetical protein